MKETIEPQVASVTPIRRPEITRRKSQIGMSLSAAYLLAIAAYVAMDWVAFLAMKPDEFGTFLGGAFAPLAFLWLVLGFFQQGEELRHSADALWLQSAELQHSVEQQRQLVEVTREQLQFESTMLERQREEVARNAQPILKLQQTGSVSAGGTTRSYSFSLLNHGKACTGLRFDVENRAHFERNSLPAGGSIDFNLELPIHETTDFKLRVDYVDERLLPGSKTFIISRTNSAFTIKDGAGVVGG